jgi:uncharacterized protein
MNTNHRAFPFELKAAPSPDGKFSGYASVFGVKDRVGDVVEPGAFLETLRVWAEKKALPVMLWHHDPQKPIGRWTHMAEDAKGLFVEGLLALKTNDGADAYEHLKAGTVSGLSIGYSIPAGGSAWDAKTETYRLKRVELWEVSPVSIPANPEAQVEDVKAAFESPRQLERLLRSAGLSRSQAKALLSGGYDALAARGGNDDGAIEALRGLAEALRGAAQS